MERGHGSEKQAITASLKRANRRRQDRAIAKRRRASRHDDSGSDGGHDLKGRRADRPTLFGMRVAYVPVHSELRLRHLPFATDPAQARRRLRSVNIHFQAPPGWGHNSAAGSALEPRLTPDFESLQYSEVVDIRIDRFGRQCQVTLIEAEHISGGFIMAFPTAVNDQITDSVTQANVKVLGDAPAIAMGNLYQATAQALANAAHNATNAQQQSYITAQAATTAGIATLFSVETVAGEPMKGL
jgi:hypothetical protein